MMFCISMSTHSTQHTSARSINVASSSLSLSLSHLHVKVHPDSPEKGQARGDGIYVEAGVNGAPCVLDAVSDGERELQFSVRAGLLHVVSGNGNGVKLGHVLGGVPEDVIDDAEGWGGGVDERIPDHVFFQYVVLDRSAQLRL